MNSDQSVMSALSLAAVRVGLQTAELLHDKSKDEKPFDKARTGF